MTRSKEKAYTPRAEYQCDNSQTHYQGCKCHEARHADEIAKSEAVAKAAAHEWEMNWARAESERREAEKENDALRADLKKAQEDSKDPRDKQLALCAKLAQAEAANAGLREALELIAAPKRPDGSYNRGREACEDIARKALSSSNGSALLASVRSLEAVADIAADAVNPNHPADHDEILMCLAGKLKALAELGDK